MLARLAVAVALCTFNPLMPFEGDMAVAADQQATYEFDVTEQPLDEALRTIARQSGTNVLFQSRDIQGIRVRALKARLTADDAVRQLLAGSSLIVERTTPTTLVVHRAAKSLTNIAAERTSSLSSRTTDVATDEPAELMLEEVIVSATKRPSSITDVPMAIQVFGQEALQKLGIEDFSDYAQYVPGVSFTKRGAGQTHVVMRGLSTGNVASSQPQNRALVGIYFDDVPTQLNGFNFDPDLFDMARVEVLKGPQGTLFGDSAMAGAIRYVTAPPDLAQSSMRISMSGSTTEQGGDNYSVRAAGNMPVIEDTFGLRAVAWHRDEAGWIDSTRGGRSDINSEQISGGRLSALYRPTEDLSVQAMALVQRSRLGARPEAELGAGNLTQDRDPEPFEDDAFMASLTVDYRLSSANLTSVTGWLDRDLINVYSTMERGFLGFFGVRFANTRLLEPWQQRSLTQELRLSSRGEQRIDYTVGVFLARFNVNFDSFGSAAGFEEFLIGAGIVPSRQGYDALGCPAQTLPDHWFCGPLDTRQKQAAAFGDVTVHVTDRLDLLMGARYFDWQQEFLQNYGGFFNGGPTLKQQSVSESGVNPRFGVTYAFAPDSEAFVSAAKGFRLGGVNDPLPVLCDQEVAEAGLRGVDRFDKDSLWSYEAGFKWSLANRRVLLNASAFYTSWDDVQTTRTLSCGYAIVQNAGKVISQGLEVDTTTALARGLRISLSGSYTDATLDEDSPNLGAVKGDRVPFVPEWKLAAFIMYEQPFGADWKGFADVGVSTQGSSFTTFSPAARNRQELPSATIGTLRIGAETQRYRVALFADNLWDERAVYDAGIQTGVRYVTYARPRTIGVELGMYFD